MNDRELNQLLRRVTPPGRSAEYWADFPRRTRVRSRAVGRTELPRPRHPALKWAGGLATAGLAVLLGLGALREARELFPPGLQRDIVRLPNNLQVFMRDEHGQHTLVSDPS
jgi:hypothetical protein